MRAVTSRASAAREPLPDVDEPTTSGRFKGQSWRSIARLHPHHAIKVATVAPTREGQRAVEAIAFALGIGPDQQGAHE